LISKQPIPLPPPSIIHPKLDHCNLLYVNLPQTNRIQLSSRPTYHGFFLLFSPSEFTERNSTIGSKCGLKTHVQIWGMPSHYKSGTQNPLISTISQLNGNFTGLYLPNETHIDNRVSALKSITGLLRRLKRTRTLVHKRLKIRPFILPTLRKFCIPLTLSGFVHGCQQTELSHTLPNGGR